MDLQQQPGAGQQGGGGGGGRKSNSHSGGRSENAAQRKGCQGSALPNPTPMSLGPLPAGGAAGGVRDVSILELPGPQAPNPASFSGLLLLSPGVSLRVQGERIHQPQVLSFGNARCRIPPQCSWHSLCAATVRVARRWGPPVTPASPGRGRGGRLPDPGPKPKVTLSSNAARPAPEQFQGQLP